MRDQTLKAPIYRDVCIFCATRLQFASANAPLRFQRRVFGSSGAVRRPPATAVTQEDSLESIVKTSTPPRWGGGWALTSPSSQLTAEEKTLRESLLQQNTKSLETMSRKQIEKDTRTAGQHFSFRKHMGINSAHTKHSQAFELYRRRSSVVQTNKQGSEQPPRRRIMARDRGSARSAYGQNDRPREEQLDYHILQSRASQKTDPRNEGVSSPRSMQDEVEIARNWKHVRRPPSLPEFQQAQTVQSSTRQGPENLEDQIVIEPLEQERLMRAEKTKDGSYVGLTDEPRAVGDLFAASETPKRANEHDLPLQEASSNLEQEIPAQLAPNTLSQTEDSPARVATSDLTSSSTAFPTAELTEELQSEVYDHGTLKDGTPATESAVEQHAPSRGRNQTRGYEITSLQRSEKNNRVQRQSHKSHVRAFDSFEEDDEGRIARKRDLKAQRKKAQIAQKSAAPPTPIHLPEFISVSNLARVLKVRVEEFIKRMKYLGFDELSNDHVLDAETAGLVAAEYNFEPIVDRGEEQELKPRRPAEDKSILPARPPVVTIMGHVDHGKTTLLDFLRKSSVAASEHGGITQHIGAFSVSMPGGRLVTFLDTPGHAAFLSMRQRGANVTDIVILVVAADDSVKPQTIEAIKHAQAAKVPMIVAVNKIDKEDSNVDRVKQDLARYGVEIEDFGGDTQVVCVSGKTGQGMGELEDAAVALADILDMRAETDGQAEGWVLEATTKKAGRVATVLVRRGTLRPGDIILAGTSWAKVRSLRNEAGAIVPFAGPGTPVEIDGWREQPSAGDEVLQAPHEQKAKSVIAHRLEATERTQMAADMAAVNESRRIEQERREQIEKAAQLAAENPYPSSAEAEAQSTNTPAGPSFKEVFLIVKADVSGSVEAVTNAITALGNTEVRAHVLRAGVGPITEFDVEHAAIAKGHVVSFNTPVSGDIARMAETKEVKLLDQSIIYRLVDDVKGVLSERLPPVKTQKVLGEAEIAQIFEINTKGREKVPVAGCRVRNGAINKAGKIRVVREGEVIYDGSLASLKNVKKEITETRKGNECGMGFEGWTEFKVGDHVQEYEERLEPRTL